MDLRISGSSWVQEQGAHAARTSQQDPPGVERPAVKSVLYDDDSSVPIGSDAVKGASYRILRSQDLANWLDVGTTERGMWRDKSAADKECNFYKVEAR